MILTTTFNLLRKADACKESYTKLRKALKGVKDTEPINLITILEVLNLDDALWALRATEQNCDKVARLMASDFAEDTLPLWHKYYPEDKRPAEAIQAARDFANGLITKEQLNIARAASDAASNTAYYAASYAAAVHAASAYAYASAYAAASYAASDAASAAAYAAYYASYAAACDAGKEKREQIFRSYLQQ